MLYFFTSRYTVALEQPLLNSDLLTVYQLNHWYTNQPTLTCFTFRYERLCARAAVALSSSVPHGGGLSWEGEGERWSESEEGRRKGSSELERIESEGERERGEGERERGEGEKGGERERGEGGEGRWKGIEV